MPMGADEPKLPVITCAGIGFSVEGLFEAGPARPMAVVPRDSIERIRLRYAFRARHPLALGMFGAILVVVGVLPAPHLVSWLFHGGRALSLEFLALVLVVVGAGAIYESLRRGYLLEIETTSGPQRLEFDRRAGASDIEGFIRRVEQAFGYSVERSDLQR
jgi:hypothetical protein